MKNILIIVMGALAGMCVIGCPMNRPNVPMERVSTPTVSVDYGGQEITVTCDTPGATIYYTTDGKEPTDSSPSGKSPVVIPGSALAGAGELAVKAFGRLEDYHDSAVAVGTARKLARPVIDFERDKGATITVTEEGAGIVYSVGNGDEKRTAESTVVIEGIDELTSITARATMDGWLDSARTTETINPNSYEIGEEVTVGGVTVRVFYIDEEFVFAVDPTLINDVQWGSYKKDNGVVVLDSIVEGAIGNGLINSTAAILAGEPSFQIYDFVNDEYKDGPTIWKELDERRRATGSDNWFIPSIKELEAVYETRTATGLMWPSANDSGVWSSNGSTGGSAYSCAYALGPGGNLMGTQERFLPGRSVFLCVCLTKLK
jgi:hypothetical protein